jgi:hypothetical protein
MTWIVYHPATSNVLRLEETQPQEEAGLGYFFTTESLAFPVPTRAEHILRFDGAKLVWHDPRTLADHKAAQWELIKQARATEIASPLVTPYGTFDADANSRTAITDSVLLLQTLSKRGRPTAIDFTLSNNTEVTLSVSQIEDVGLMLGEKTNLAFAKGRLLRAQIGAATTPEQVAAVVW